MNAEFVWHTLDAEGVMAYCARVSSTRQADNPRPIYPRRHPRRSLDGCEISPEYCEVILQRCEAEGLTVERTGQA